MSKSDSITEFLKDVGSPWWVVWPARLLRKIGLRAPVRAVRTRATLGILGPLHVGVIHRMRNLALSIQDWNDVPPDLGFRAVDVCTSCANVMSDLLEIPEQEFHCCLKVFGPEMGTVATLARSVPFDERPSDEHGVQENTVWSALLGHDDGSNHWRPMNCFCCNDLWAHKPYFHCSRTNWEHFYRSVLVFPLRYVYDPVRNQYRTIGFLCFDSPNANAFPKMPDAFEYRGRPDRYRQKLAAQPAFHLGAIMADSLSMFLRASYERNANVEEPGQ